MTKPPAAGDALTRAIQMRRRAISTGRAAGVRATQAGGYVGVKLRPPPPVDRFPVAKAWLELFANGRRDAGKMAREACRVGRSKGEYPHQGKNDNRVKAELRALGLEHLWKQARVKSGRPSVPRQSRGR